MSAFHRLRGERVLAFFSGCGAGASFAFSLDLTLGLVGQNMCEGFQDPLTIGLATFREASPLPCL